MLVTTEMLGKTYHINMKYEKSASTLYHFDSDFFRIKRLDSAVRPVPFELTKNDIIDFKI